MLFILPGIEHLYIVGVAHGLPNMILRGAACAICLLPPTVLMGATLPAISRWVAATPQAAAWWGYFYGSNIAGGVLGCFAGGFYLLRLHDMAFASYVAASINLLVAILALGIVHVTRAAMTHESIDPNQGVEDLSPPAPAVAPQLPAVHLVIAVSGLCALGAEVIWTRILSLILGPTVYTFSIILGVFLAGLGIGSAVGSRIAHRREQRLICGSG